ncbi:MAG: cation:proton antiporter [Alphaproteobacteria bacterium]|nr:cation:proton antiporter [Alphaproteobacteria bacterium]
MTYLYNFLCFLMAAVGIVFIFRRMKASPVLGYLAAGMLIGPHVLKIITDPTATQVLGEIGVLFLLFTLGLELPLQRLQSMKKYVFGLGVAQVFVTAAIFTFIGVLLGLPKETSLLVGGALSLSSTAVVLQVLIDRKEMATRFGRVSFSVLLFQDFAVVLLLILATTLGREDSNLFFELTLAIFKTSVVLIIIIGIGRIIFRPIYRAVAMSGNPELFMATTFLVVLGTAFLTETAGLSMELGAFLAGILLAETEYRHQVEADIQPFKGLLLGVFFMSVGMGIHVSVLLNDYEIILGFLAVMLTLKALLIFFLSRLVGLKGHTSIKVSLLLAGGGEFVFVIFSPLVSQKFLPPNITDILFLVVVLSMALTPFLAMLGKCLADKHQVYETHADPQVETEELGEFNNHIIIAGFGRVGQMLGDLLASHLIPFVALDTDMRCVTEGRNKGWPVFYGDAKQLEVLKSVGAERAKAIVITLNQITPSVRTVLMLRRYFPALPVCVRIKDHNHQEKLLDSGARLVVPETVEPTMQLATSILHVMGMPQNEITQLLDTFRRQHWMS